MSKTTRQRLSLFRMEAWYFMIGEDKVSRRSFLKLIGSAGVVGTGLVASGCSGDQAGGKGWMPSQYENKGNYAAKVKGRIAIDEDNPSIMRDDAKCIL